MLWNWWIKVFYPMKTFGVNEITLIIPSRPPLNDDVTVISGRCQSGENSAYMKTEWGQNANWLCLTSKVNAEFFHCLQLCLPDSNFLTTYEKCPEGSGHMVLNLYSSSPIMPTRQLLASHKYVICQRLSQDRWGPFFKYAISETYTTSCHHIWFSLWYCTDTGDIGVACYIVKVDHRGKQFSYPWHHLQWESFTILHCLVEIWQRFNRFDCDKGWIITCGVEVSWLCLPHTSFHR